MNADKKMRVDLIRQNTAYPAYRALIGIITIILMILAASEAISAIGVGVAVGSQVSGIAGFFTFLVIGVSAVLSFFLAKIWNEGAQILVDIGDSVLDANPVALPSVSNATRMTSPVSVPSSAPLSPPAITPPGY